MRRGVGNFDAQNGGFFSFRSDETLGRAQFKLDKRGREKRQKCHDAKEGNVGKGGACVHGLGVG